MDIYDELIKRSENQESLSNVYVFKACCLYALCQYKEAKAECEKAEKVCQEHIGLVDVPATFLLGI